MKNASHTNTTSSVQVVGFADNCPRILATFGSDLTSLVSLPYADDGRKPLRDAHRAASAWIEEKDGATGLDCQFVCIVAPSQTVNQ